MSTAEVSWSEIKVEGIARIDRVAAVFEIWPRGSDFPFASFKIKVVERAGADFLGAPNIAIRNPVTGHPEYISGLGRTVEDALADTLKYFLREVKQHTPATGLTEADFVWLHEDF